MKTLGNVLLALVSTLVTLAALEGLSWIGGRVELPGPQAATRNPNWNFRYGYDPLLFWHMRPDSDLGTNRLGLRGPEVLDKQPGEFRILSLGESTTFAGRLPYEECYSAIVESELELPGWSRSRVINAGVPGYTLFQGYQYLKHRGLQLEPDAVLLYFGYNDFLPVAHRALRDAALDSETTGLSDRKLFEQRRRPAFRLAGFLLEHSNLFRRVSLSRDSGAEFEIKRDPSVVRVPEEDRRALLEAFRSLAAEHSLQLAIVIPWYHDFEDHIPLLRDFTRSTGIPVVDLPARLRHLPGRKDDYFLDPVHPNSVGHRLMADAILEELVTSWQ